MSEEGEEKERDSEREREKKKSKLLMSEPVDSSRLSFDDFSRSRRVASSSEAVSLGGCR